MNKILVLIFIITTGCLRADWVHTGGATGSHTVTSLVASGSIIFAGTNPNGVYISTDNGASWEARNNGLPGSSGLIMSMTVNNSNVYAAVWGYGIYVTTNNGTSWAPRPGADSYTRSLASNGGILYAGGLYGLHTSTNGGTNWVSASGGIPPSAMPVTSFVFSGSNIFAGCHPSTGGVYLSTNGGANWTAKNNGLFQMSVYSLYSGPGYLLAGVAASPSAFKSTDSAGYWDASGTGLPSSSSVNAMVTHNSNVMAGTSAGVYYTTNQGAGWSNFSAGLPPNQSVSALLITGGNIYAAVGGVGVWKRSASEVGISQLSTGVPKDYSLGQNYPNPFNPSTSITFSLPVQEKVKLTVLDMLGRETAVLVNEHLAAGTYSAELDASHLPSGVYFYILEAGDFKAVRKMALIK